VNRMIWGGGGKKGAWRKDGRVAGSKKTKKSSNFYNKEIYAQVFCKIGEPGYHAGGVLQQILQTLHPNRGRTMFW